MEPVRDFVARLEKDWDFVQGQFGRLKHQAAIAANRSRTDCEFAIGQQVPVSHRRLASERSKLNPKAVGPFAIKAKVTQNTYVLDIPIALLGRASPVFHSSELIPYESRLLHPEAGVDHPDAPQAELEAEIALAEEQLGHKLAPPHQPPQALHDPDDYILQYEVPLGYMQSPSNLRADMRWLEILQEYRLTVTQINGTQNTAADALYRLVFPSSTAPDETLGTSADIDEHISLQAPSTTLIPFTPLLLDDW